MSQMKETPIKSQTQDKWLGCLFDTSKQSWLPGSPSIPQPLCVTGSSWLAYSVPYSELSRSGSWAVLPYIFQTFWLPTPFVSLPSWLPHLVPLSPFSFPSQLPQWPSSIWSCPRWILPDVPVSFYTLPSLYNKLFPLPSLGAAMFFPLVSVFCSTPVTKVTSIWWTK